MVTSSTRRLVAVVTVLAAVVTALFLVSFLVGRFPIALRDVVAILFQRLTHAPQTWTDTMETVVLGIRLPRIIAALLVGGALASAGAAYQSLFKNPLVSPAILGVSAGAGFGAAVALWFALPWFGVQSLAFAGGLFAVFCTLSIGRALGSASLTALVLGGVVVSALFEALISLLKFAADPVNKLPAITFWLLGGLAKAGPNDVLVAALPIVLGMATLFLVRWQVNVLALGDDEARALGVDARRVRMLVIVATTLMTAAAVSISGIVGWVGLLIPHIARMIVGPRFDVLMPVAFLLGAGYLLAVDDVVRMLEMEVPLGIVTALIGAPFFVYLLIRARRTWA